MANNIKITSEKLKSINPCNIEEFKTSAGFCHYTSVEKLIKILENKTFRFSPITNANDIDEANLHKEDGKNIYTFCLCNSDTEKIPMWYLYAGITGKGARIRLTPGNMKNMISSIEKVKTDSGIILQKGKDFNIEFGRIFYRKNDLKTVKHKNTFYELEDYDNFNEDNYFIKNYSWEYEKEFRIIIKVKNGEQYDCLYAYIPDKVLDEFKIKFAPEMTKEEIRQTVENNRVLLDYLLSKFDYSELDIKMGLLNRFHDDIRNVAFGSFETFFNSKEDFEKICGIIKNKGECENDLEPAIV